MIETHPKLNGFFGGAQLDHHKGLAFQHPIARAENIKALHLPLTGYGAIVESDLERRLQVRPGQTVSRGQVLLIAEDDAMTALHAPLDGIVEGVVDGPGLHAHAPSVPHLHLRVDPAAESPPLPDDVDPSLSLPKLELDALADVARTHGLVGLGGAQFPTAEKLRYTEQHIHTLIVNGVECEPYIACDEALMRQRPHAIIMGAKLIAHALGAQRVIVAIEDPLADVLGPVNDIFQSCIDHHACPDVTMTVVTVPQRFPQGSERQLIQTLTGLEVPHLGLPQDLGLLCSNVATVAGLCDAVIEGIPLTHRLVTVTGPGVVSPVNVYAPVGTSIEALLAMAGGRKPECDRLMLGGPVSGEPLVDERASIDKGSLCVLALTPSQASSRLPVMPCINCGFCVDVCPARLMPQLLYKTASQNDYAKSHELGLFDCIECGLCAEVCPSHLPLLETYRHGKDWLRAKALDERRAALARKRHLARQQRMEEQEKARQARRQARAERLQARDSAQSEIEAAIARARAKKVDHHD